MLIPDTDRNAFYTFIREHLICTMGDGRIERRTDIRTAFDLRERIHEKTGRTVRIAGTSCRMVNFQNLGRELMQNGFVIVKQGATAIEPDFPQIMFAVDKAR